jgi:hypothetical protein
MNYYQKETAYQDHIAEESMNPHIEGCFYCGGYHHSDCCPDSESVNEYWDGYNSPDRE